MLNHEKSMPDKKATRHWLSQRLSAICLVLLGSWLLFILSQLKGLDYLAVKQILAKPLNAAGVFLFIMVASYHWMLGLQVVVDDYCHTPRMRILGHFKVKLFGYLFPILSLFFLIKIMG